MNSIFFVANLLSAIGLYSVNAAFTVTMFISGSIGPDRILQGAFAIAFELSKIGLWVEGLAKRQVSFMLLGICFSLGSLVTASVGLTGKEDNKRELVAIRNDAESVTVDSTQATIGSLQIQLDVELQRLASGSVAYRTDAEQTRASIDALESQLAIARATLVAAYKARVATIESTGATESNPFTVLSLRLKLDPSKTRFGFSIYQALMLELGGLATTAAAIATLGLQKAFKHRELRPAPTPKPTSTVPVSAGVGAVEPSGVNAGKIEVLHSAKLAKLADLAYGSGRSRNGKFPSVVRAYEILGILPDEYTAIVKKAVLAGMAVVRSGQVYLVRDITPGQFLKEVTNWPQQT